MTETNPFPRWWVHYALAVSLVALLGLGLGVNGIYTDRSQNEAAAAANRARDAESARLLACFDDFATDLAGGLPPIREATAARDVATGARDDASRASQAGFQALIGVLIESFDPDADQDALRVRFGEVIQRLEKSGRELAAAAIELDKAQANLEKTRAENPYPESPRSSCPPD